MTIKFKCPNCQSELSVKDELAGKMGKCPACKNPITVPRSGAAPRSSVPPPPSSRRISRPAEDVVEAEVLPEDDEPPRRSRRREEVEEVEEVEEIEDEPRRRPARRRRDDEDDRPRRRRPAARSRRGEDYDDEYDEDPEQAAKRKKKAARFEAAGWRRARTGVFLNWISFCTYAGAIGVAVLNFLIFALVFLASKTPPKSEPSYLKIFGILTMLPLLATYILATVGMGFTVTSTPRNGAMGLGIAGAALSGIGAICYLVMMIKFLDVPRGFGLYLGFTLMFIVTNPLWFLKSGGSGTSGSFGGGLDTGFVFYLFPWIEVARLTVFALYLWSAGKCLRDKQTESSGFLLGIVGPSSCVGLGLLFWLFQVLTEKATSPWPMIIFGTFYGLGLVGILVWYLFVTQNANSVIE
jgi:hypothetical protein